MLRILVINPMRKIFFNHQRRVNGRKNTFLQDKDEDGPVLSAIRSMGAFAPAPVVVRARREYWETTKISDEFDFIDACRISPREIPYIICFIYFAFKKYNELLGNKTYGDLYEIPSLLFIGKSGIGKSASIKDTAKLLARMQKLKFVDFSKISVDEEEFENIMRKRDEYFVFVDLRLTELEPYDITGVIRDKEYDIGGRTIRVSEHVPFSWAIALGRGPGMLFLDEFTHVQRKDTQSAAFKIVLDRKLGQVKLHKDVLIIAAGNDVSESNLAITLDLPLRNRFLIFYVKSSTKDFLSYVNQKRKHIYLENLEKKINEFLKKTVIDIKIPDVDSFDPKVHKFVINTFGAGEPYGFNLLEDANINFLTPRSLELFEVIYKFIYYSNLPDAEKSRWLTIFAVATMGLDSKLFLNFLGCREPRESIDELLQILEEHLQNRRDMSVIRELLTRISIKLRKAWIMEEDNKRGQKRVMKYLYRIADMLDRYGRIDLCGVLFKALDDEILREFVYYMYDYGDVRLLQKLRIYLPKSISF